jgi:hypothetical protein
MGTNLMLASRRGVGFSETDQSLPMGEATDDIEVGDMAAVLMVRAQIPPPVRRVRASTQSAKLFRSAPHDETDQAGEGLDFGILAASQY